ncbi:sigma 54-interacting transcriptional regulator [Desulfobacula sp.]|uniref:sigma 54-interacting transcriptional regulator n=1 Tax=Desulfobacula sp. TaxID=2593537 RepID=UPI0026086D5D|nr:sigma 54-interacting transcriptional regulator [Desulfobacula sp.]
MVQESFEKLAESVNMSKTSSSESDTAKKLLVQTENRYNRMLENLKDEFMFFTHDTNKRFILLSPSVKNILGYTPEEYKKHIDELWTDHPGNINARKHTELSVRGIRQPPYEVDVFHKDGSARRLVIIEAPFFDESGRVLFVEGMARDITQKRKVEEKLEKYREHLEELVDQRTIELKNSQQQLQEIIDFLPDPTYVVDSDKTIIAWNNALEEILDVPKHKAMGKQFYDFIKPFYNDDVPLLIDLIGVEPKNPIFRNFKISKEGKLLFSERFIQSMNSGKGGYVWVTATPILNRDGKSVGAIESIRDVTHIKNVETRVLESERKLSTLMNNLPGMAYRLVKKKHWEMEFVSKGSRLVTGHEPSFFMGKSLKELKTLIHPDDLGRIPSEIFNTITKRRKPARTEYRIIDYHGEVKWVFDRAEGVLFDDDKLVVIEGLLTDFTVFKQKEQKLQHENLYLRSTIKDRYKFDNIIGNSPAMQAVYELILKAAGTSDSVFIHGESGTGKELVAQAIHNASDRRGAQFVAVNCGAIPETLIENEFFGSKKGAFTGSNMDKPGYLDMADGGTLFLDEVGEISPALQVKLLRAIEGGGYSPVGSTQVKKPNLRILAASNKDLMELVKKGRIRHDFYFRIHVLPIHLPPLRKRGDDLFLIIDHFFKTYSKTNTVTTLAPKDLITLKNYHWPGNIRELQNVLRRYVILKNLDFLQGSKPMDASLEETSEPVMAVDKPFPLKKAVGNFEKRHIQEILNQNQWQKGKSSKLLGISRKTLFRKMKTYGLI